LQSQSGNGMWRSWLAHHVRDVGVVCSSQIIPTKEVRKIPDLFFYFTSLVYKTANPPPVTESGELVFPCFQPDDGLADVQ